jgi:hypothetical protein
MRVMKHEVVLEPVVSEGDSVSLYVEALTDQYPETAMTSTCMGLMLPHMGWRDLNSITIHQRLGIHGGQ